MNIKKQLRFTYRYLATSGRWRRWFNSQVLVVMAATAIFIGALAWSTLLPANGARAQRNPISVTLTLTANSPAKPTATPFPAEYLNNGQQTIGITFAGAILVLIIVIGVMVFMPKKVE